jgi:hypothetical protein
VITTHAGELVGIHLRPFPKLVSLPEVWPVHWKYHPAGSADTCTLFYNQSRRCPTYLALRYMASTSGTHYRTFLAALRVLDRIAAIKQTDAIVCDVGNFRISDRLLARLGWEPHKPQRLHRNYIKRFYGKYPA